MDYNIEYFIAKLDGFFEAFAWFNNKTNNQFQFETCDNIIFQKNGNEDFDIKRSINEFFSHEASKISIERNEDWKAELLNVLNKWLFRFQSQGNDPIYGPFLRDDKNDFSLFSKLHRNHLLEQLIDDIIKISDPICAYNVTLVLKEFFANDLEILVIEGNRYNLVLRFELYD